MNNSEMTKDQLIEKVEQLEQKVEEKSGEIDDLQGRLAHYHEIEDFDKTEFAEHVFYKGAMSHLSYETTLKAWLNYKIEAGL